MAMIRRSQMRVLLAALMLLGCGYSAAPLVSADYNTIAVDTFGNDTFERGLEFQLTEATAKRIEQNTHLKLAAKSRADLVMTGVVRDFDRRVLSESTTDETLEKQVTVRVDVQVRERATGRLIVDRKNLVWTGESVPLVGEPETVATNDAVVHLAEYIVQQLEEPW